MTAIATLTGPLPKLGVIAVAMLAAWSMLATRSRSRAVAMLGALVLAPVLLLAEIWHSPQLHLIHRHPLYALVGACLAVAAVGAVAVVVHRRPAVLAALTVAALPFRVPIESGGKTSNLLVPLYFVVAAGALSYIVPALRNEDVHEEPHAGWLERLLGLYIVLYGIQATYSDDFHTALRNMVFFYVPFALVYVLLMRIRWDRRLLTRALQILAMLALAFACIAFVEYATKTIILNTKLVRQNDLHTYFVVNSVFYDPDIFGRFLAIVMVTLAALLVYDFPRREQVIVAVVLAVLWCGLVLTLSRSSLLALLVGVGALIAIRYGRWRHVLVAAAVVVALGGIAVAISPKTFGLNQGLNGVSSGRGSLLKRGVGLFGDRPVFGFGSGSFENQYRAHHRHAGPLSASHTIPITIAAEQGIVGEIVYLALVIVALVSLLRGARSDPARAAIAAAFLALVCHTLLYADFLEDPITWALLGVGMSLARAAPQTAPERSAARVGAVAPAPA
jgi:O-antigen ligase